MKHARGQNIFFQNGSPLMCFCGFATRQFYTLKNQSIRHDMEIFKVKISSDHLTSNTYTHGKKLGNTSCVTRVQSKYILTKLFHLSKSVVSKVASV